ncbi:hypothetical protein PV325_001131 [Microctonus aethiopoides]|uniref:Uncharacterized protein n=1 Tax=Microctonus aethiopoides TaxID=144406 RepID=A0AA39C5B6_9HYME|nr:hypothetical protein PV325_001131 [Microctonus aethiopoides]KAK0158200.1 hypothetical protein PV328_009234 [Microctonus aethiopoides]
MKKNDIRCTTSVVAFTIAILIVLHIQDNEARMTMAQIQNAMKPVYKTCVTKSGVSKEMVAKTHEGEFPPDPTLQCYYACILRMMKILDSHDKLNINAILKQIDLMLPEPRVIPTKEVSQSCYDKVTSTDPCESSWQWTKCFYETNSSKMTTAQIRNMLKPVSNNCIQKTGVSKDLIAKTHDGEFLPDPALQCYFSCIFKMMKVISKDDKIDITMIMKQMDLMVQEDIAGPIKETCQSCYDKLTSSEVCEASWELVKCFYETDPSSSAGKECPLKAALEKSIDACKDKLSEANANLLKDDEFADNEEIRCFRACVMNYAGIMENKDINIEKISEMMKDNIEGVSIDEVMEVLKMCKAQAEEGLNECDAAGLFANCFKDVGKDEEKA